METDTELNYPPFVKQAEVASPSRFSKNKSNLKYVWFDFCQLHEQTQGFH